MAELTDKEKTYRAEMHDYCLRWMVKSQSTPEPYLVDLSVPACQCKWHKCEVAPMIRKGLKPRKMCVHYHVAKNAFSDWAIQFFKEHDNNKEQT